MDTNILFVFLTALIILISISLINDGLPLIILGFLIIFFAWNITTTFEIQSSSLGGFGNLIILSYWILGVFAFGKSIITARNIKRG